MTREIDWFVDYVSPYPYLQLARFDEFPDDVVVRPRPVLFAGLLNHWGHKGPAEIKAKARHLDHYCRWAARKRGLPFAGPPRHPFNPLAMLRLTEAAGATVEATRIAFTHLWGEGNDGQDPESIARLAARLGVEDHEAKLADPALKAKIRANTDEAISYGVFGVPTFVIDGRLFWGDDVTDMMIDYLNDPAMFEGAAFEEFENRKAASTRIARVE